MNYRSVNASRMEINYFLICKTTPFKKFKDTVYYIFTFLKSYNDVDIDIFEFRTLFPPKHDIIY